MFSPTFLPLSHLYILKCVLVPLHNLKVCGNASDAQGWGAQGGIDNIIGDLTSQSTVLFV